MYTLRVKQHFSAAHLLKSYEGKCRALHGHTWGIEIAIKGNTLDSRNILLDFAVVKGNLQSVLDAMFDHRFLNDSLEESNPTAEFIAQVLFNTMKLSYTGLKSITIWESPECSVTFEEEL